MSDQTQDNANSESGARAQGRLASFGSAIYRNDLVYDFLHNPTAIVAALVMLAFAVSALFPDIVAPYPVFDLNELRLDEAFLPPSWLPDGELKFPLGTDDQGRDMISAIIYGLRISLFVGIGGVSLAIIIGVTVGLIAGYVGGIVDSVLMRVADIQLTFPAILIAVMIDGISRAAFGQGAHDQIAAFVLIVAIGLSGWVQYARAVRGATMVERRQDYVAAARLIGVRTGPILLGHIMPNVMTSVLVIGTIHLAIAVILEATLSFVGLGIPPTEPSLGTLIRIGNGYLLSGEWWIAIMPGAALLILVLSINLLGDFLRDALNPRLR